MHFDRRQFLRGLAGTSAAALLADRIGWSQSALPPPQHSPIQHIVVVMMENRSFDHLFGWIPGADGKQAGLTYVDASNRAYSTYALGNDYTGCGHRDPDHSYDGSRTAYDNGLMDGWLRAGKNDRYAIGYYGLNEIPFYGALALNYTVFDRSHASILSATFPNRLFLLAAQTDRLGDTIDLTSLPTIWDRLAAKGVSARYYFNNLPFLALWGFKYAGITRLYQEFLDAAATGSLPSVSFIDPRFTVLDDGTGNDDHPHADIRNGDAFLAKTFHAVANGPAWPNTVFIVTFDEWGGFFDHVPPPRVPPANNVDTDRKDGKVLLGCRIPMVVASPFTFSRSAMRPRIIDASRTFDHTSVLKLIEWRWGLDPLTPRDAASEIANLAEALDFSSPVTTVPALPTPHSVFAWPCFGGGIFSSGATTAPRSAATARESADSQAEASPWTALANTETVRRWHDRMQAARDSRY